MDIKKCPFSKKFQGFENFFFSFFLYGVKKIEQNKGNIPYNRVILIYKIQKIMTTTDEYFQNKVKVYDNTCLQIKEQFNYDMLYSDYMELKSLFELFGDRANPKRVKQLHKREKEIDSVYKPLIKEAKRVLKNTEKRLQYNINRVEQSQC